MNEFPIVDIDPFSVPTLTTRCSVYTLESELNGKSQVQAAESDDLGLTRLAVNRR